MMDVNRRDLIDRKAAIDFIAAGHLCNSNEPRWSDNEVVNFLKSRPSAQRTGRWIFVNKFRGQHKCSVCGIVAVQARNGFHLESSPFDNTGEQAIVIDHYKEFLSDYCPNCGARMEEQE